MTHWRLDALTFSLFLLTAGDAMSQPAAGGPKEEVVRRDTIPPLLSLYLPIPLGVPGVDDPATGVFVPKDYRVGDTVDLVLFLRGYDIKRPKTATSVAEYWNSPEHSILKSFRFRQEVNQSGKNVILVVPALGPFAEAGKLRHAGGVREFLDRILDGLWRSGPMGGRRHQQAARQPRRVARRPCRCLRDLAGRQNARAHPHSGRPYHEPGFRRPGAQDAVRDGREDAVSVPGERVGLRHVSASEAVSEHEAMNVPRARGASQG